MTADNASAGRVPVPAATVALLRDGANGVETLMLRRDVKVSFGAHWVFPGGKVDAADREAGGDELAAARRAAVRETAEECGVVLAAAELVPLSHWVPPVGAPRRYATWFFLCRADDAAAVAVDDSEIREHRWLAPARVLELRDAGEIQLAPPTWITLDLLAGAGSVAQALGQAAAQSELPHYATDWHNLPNGGAVALWTGDAGYATSDPDVPGPRHRLWMAAERWWLERS